MPQVNGPAIASIVSLWVAGPLYGSNIILGSICLLLLCRKGEKIANRALILLILVQFLLSTGQMVSILVQLIRGFVHTPPGLVPDQYFANQATRERVAEIALYLYNSIVTDCFMTWRVFVFWERNYFLTLPFATLNIVVFVSSTMLTQSLANAPASVGPAFFAGKINHLALITWAVSLVTQTSGTLLIVWRQCATPVAVSNSRHRHPLHPIRVLGTVIDSGALYSSIIVLLLVFYVRQSAAGVVMSSILGQFSATTTLSIILREWWKLAKAKMRGPVLPRTTILSESHELPIRSVSPIQTGTSSDDNDMVVRVVTSTHMQADSEYHYQEKKRGQRRAKV